MENDGQKKGVQAEDQSGEMNGEEATIVLDGRATEGMPDEPSLMERTKKVLEDIGTKINSI